MKEDTTSPRNTLNVSSGVVVASGEVTPLPTQTAAANVTSLPFDEEAKLVYGVLLSLRNMIKKLSGRDETFVSYRTSTYRMHLFETISGYKFVLLTDPVAAPDTVRIILRRIYTGPFIEYVVRNPLISMDSKEEGIDNDRFRESVDRLVRGLSIYS